MILVTGAAGKTGKAVIRALAARGQQVHAYVHRDAHVPALRELGAAAVSVGAFDNADAITQAAKEARAIYHICPNVSPRELPFARAVTEGVSRAGVRRFVFHSVLHPQIEAMPHHWEKMRVEEMLFASGLDVTVLQPTAYMQNLLAQWPTITAEGVFNIPYPATSRISLVDLDDVAEAAAVVLTNDTHTSASYELVGTPPLSQFEIAGVIGQTTGKNIRIEAETPEEWAARATGLDSYQRETLTKMFRYYAQHGLIGSSGTLRWLLGREPTTLAAFVRRQA
jgi:NAD(P)H dehydrogenase (quinone)